MILSYILYKNVFKKNSKKEAREDFVPKDEQYLPYKEAILKNYDNIKDVPYKDVYTNSFDHLKLHGRLYVNDLNKPFVIFFHGYRSSAIRDFTGGYKMCNARNFNMLVVDQRAHGKSEGKTITFGAKEQYDVFSWVNYIDTTFGKDTKILLIGISMGASTILNASKLNLGKNVCGIISDCGYSSGKGIIYKVAKEEKYPKGLTKLLVSLGSNVFGHFTLKDADMLESVKNSHYPILFIHGRSDRFVPFEMGEELFKACNTYKDYLYVDNAGHGMSYYNDTDAYTKKVNDFIDYCIK